MSVSTWQGWSEVPSPGGGWLDLSHTIYEGMPKIGFFPDPRVEHLMCMPKNPMNVTELSLAVHVGTHIDAPIHFIPDGPSCEAIPLERLYGPGVVWRVDKEPFGLIDVADLKAAMPQPERGDIVLIDTGWSDYFKDERYDQHPSFTPEAAHWFLSRHVKFLGVDFSTPDLAVSKRPKRFDWPVHKLLLSNGVLIGEHLTNLRPLANKRVDVMFLGIKVRGADGSPTRVVARESARKETL